MDPGLARLLNGLGLLLEFLSFCLTAPEFLGEKRLLDLETMLERSLRRGVEFLTLLPAIMVLLGLMGVCVLSMLTVVTSNTTFATWMGVLAVVILFVLEPLAAPVRKIGKRWVSGLASSAERRQSVFVLGVSLLLVGMALQFVAMF